MKRMVLFCAGALCALHLSAVPASSGVNTLFWKAKSSAGTVYLLGSIHASNASIYPLPAKIEAAFDAADYLVVEANVMSSADPGMLMAVQENGYYPEGGTLKSDLPSNVYSRFADECRKRGLDAAFFQQMRPWLAATLFSQMLLMQAGYSPAAGIDSYFLSKAMEGKEILELESVSFQLNLLAGLDRSQQELFLEHTVGESVRFEEVMERMQDLWKGGDGQGIAGLARESFEGGSGELAPLYRKLITERNVSMAAKIERYLQTGKTYFVVVGAVHLLGKGGLVELLNNKGYVLTNP